MSRSVRTVITLTTLLTAIGVLLPNDAFAQRGHARVGVAVPRAAPPYVYRPIYRPYYYRSYYRPYYYAPYYYAPYYYTPFYASFYWGWPWGPYGSYAPASYYGQYPPYRYAYDEASLRIQVTPRDAHVYLDGYYVGMVDSFDGTFQRLHLSPGEHLVEIYREGYRTIREPMMFQPRAGYQLRRAMEPLTPGEPPAERPRPDPTTRRAPPSYPGDAPRERPENMREPRGGQVRAERTGAVAIRVQPAGATVIIDGEKWQAPEGPEPLVVHLSEGIYRIQVQKNGYRPFMTEVRIRGGETAPLNISLRADKELVSARP